MKSYTAAELAQLLADPSLGLRDRKIGDTTLGEALDQLAQDPELSASTVNPAVTVGNVVDFLKSSQAVQSQRDKTFTFKATVGELMDVVGEENVREFVMRKTAEASRKPEYERTLKNIVKNWLMLGVFILVFAALATIALELIDKDKR